MTAVAEGFLGVNVDGLTYISCYLVIMDSLYDLRVLSQPGWKSELFPELWRITDSNFEDSRQPKLELQRLPRAPVALY